MAFQPAPRCAEAVLSFAGNSAAWKHVLNFQYPTTYGTEQISDLATVVSTWAGAQLRPLMCSNQLYQQTLVRGLALENDITFLSTVGTGIGTHNVDPEMANVALAITHRSALTGRSARGRSFVGGIPSDVTLDSKFVDDAYALACAAAFNALRPIVEAESWKFVVLSRFNAGAKRASAIAFEVVVSQRRNAAIDSQRGRLQPGH